MPSLSEGGMCACRRATVWQMQQGLCHILAIFLQGLRFWRVLAIAQPQIVDHDM